jgi:hypothetical protein
MSRKRCKKEIEESVIMNSVESPMIGNACECLRLYTLPIRLRAHCSYLLLALEEGINEH